MESTKKENPWLSVACALLILLALAALFLPIAGTKTATGETIQFFGWTVFFGGTMDVELPSGVYSFAFEANIALIVLTQGFLLSAISCFLGRSSRFNRIFSLCLALATFVGLCFCHKFIALFSSLPESGIENAVGHGLSMMFLSMAILLEFFLLVFYWKPKEKKEKN